MNIDEHRATPHISIDRHAKSRVVQLGRSIDGKTTIYLDTKFWLMMRKASIGKGDEQSNELLRFLRSLVKQGKVCCPISDSIFLELLKQSDSTSRKATALLIDELSLGIALLTNEARVATELAHFFHSCESGHEGLYPLRHLIWSKLSYVLGFMHPTGTPFDAETELAIQKAFFDRMWEIPLTEMIEKIGNPEARDDLDLSDVAAALNLGAAKHAQEILSFEQAWDAELRGVADLCANVAADIVSDMAERKSGATTAPNSPEWIKRRNQCANVIYASLRNKEHTRKLLPTLYIEACLHAGIRWDKKRRLTGNDIYDFNHASAALAHCRAFFTEHSLLSQITSKRIALDKFYDCHVVSEVGGALAYLKGHGLV